MGLWSDGSRRARTARGPGRVWHETKVRWPRVARDSRLPLAPRSVRPEDVTMPATRVSITAGGISAPLGATVMPDGVNFSVFSRHATAVEILFFDGVDDARPTRTVRLDATRNRTYHYWHAFVPSVRPGQLYGYRVEGRLDPARGLCFDPGKVLLDPYGRGVACPSSTAARPPPGSVATPPRRP